MKTNSIKRVAMVLCAASIAIAALPVSTVQAASFSVKTQGVVQTEAWRTRPFLEMTQEQQEIVRGELRKAGLSDAEINTLAAQEKELLRKSHQGVSFFGSPRRGQTRRRSFTIYMSDLVLGASAVSDVLQSNGIPLGVAAGLVTAVLSVVADNTNISGVRFTVRETYGYNNDGFLAWNVGPVTWKVIR